MRKMCNLSEGIYAEGKIEGIGIGENRLGSLMAKMKEDGRDDEAFAGLHDASRLSGEWGTVFGTLPTGLDLASIIERATPKVGS